jgi:hypothetical protein
MNEKEIRESIKALTVQIITPKERGTGVLIQYQKRLYVLTVNHVIYGKAHSKHGVDADEVKFVFFNQAELYAINIKNFGELTLLEIDPKELPLSNFGAVKFSEVEYGQEYYIRGFPSGLEKAHNFRAKCNDIERETFKLEIENLTNDTSGEDAIEYMRGVSGSGVFFNRDKKLYLVGLVNALANQSGTFNAVESVNLRKLLNKKSLPSKSSFNYLWLGLPLVFGVLAFLFYPNGSESEALAPKKEEATRLKPSIPSEKKRAVLHINSSEFSSMIESRIAKEITLVDDEKLANYMIDVTSTLQQKESILYGETIVKSDCQLNLNMMELQNRERVNSEVYNATATGFDKESSGRSCFQKLLERIRF